MPEHHEKFRNYPKTANKWLVGDRLAHHDDIGLGILTVLRTTG